MRKAKQKIVQRKPVKKPRDKKKKRLGFRIIGFFLKLGIIVSLFFALMMFARDYVKKSKFFNIKNIVVIGNHMLSYNEIQDNLLIKEGMNIHSVSSYNIKKVLLNKFPEIKDIKVRRYYPSKIKIIVIENTPIARIKLNNKNILVSENYKIFSDRLPNEKFIDIEPIFYGKYKTQLVDIISFIKHLNELGYKEFCERMTNVHINEDKDIVFVFGDMGVIFGELDYSLLKCKMKYLFKVLKDLRVKNVDIKIINLKYFKKSTDSIVVEKK